MNRLLADAILTLLDKIAPLCINRIVVEWHDTRLSY
jgi:hypothetical protein